MSPKFKPYKPLFEQKKTVKDVKQNLQSYLKELSKIKRSLKKMREEDEVDSGAVEDAIDSVEEVIQDVIDDLGVTSPAVDTLVDAAKELEAGDEEEFDFDDDEFMEAEDDEDEDDKEDMEEAEEDDDDEDDDEDEDDEDEEKRESVKKPKKKNMKESFSIVNKDSAWSAINQGVHFLSLTNNRNLMAEYIPHAIYDGLLEDSDDGDINSAQLNMKLKIIINGLKKYFI